jgi:hypothetical protein
LGERIAPVEGAAEGGEKVIGHEGLIHVEEGAAGVAFLLVTILAHAGEDDNGDVEGGALGGEPAGDFEAIDIGKHEIKDDGVGMVGKREVDGLFAGGGGEVLDIFKGEVLAEQFVDFLIVLDDQHFGSHGKPGCGQ